MGREGTGDWTPGARYERQGRRQRSPKPRHAGAGNGNKDDKGNERNDPQGAQGQRDGGGDVLPLVPRLGDAEALAGADLFRALADPTRLQILDVLGHGKGEISVRELEGVVGLPDPRTGRRPRQPTISHHLKILRTAGLVGYRRRGPWLHYYVRGERVAAARALLERLAT